MLRVSLTTKSIRDSKLLGLVVKIRATNIHQCKLIDLGISWVLYVIFTCTHCVFQCGIHVFVQTHMCIRACAEYVPMDVFFLHCSPLHSLNWSSWTSRTCQLAHGILCIFLPSAGVKSRLTCPPVSSVGLGDQFLVLPLWQELCQLNNLPGSLSSYHFTWLKLEALSWAIPLFRNFLLL